MSCVSLRSAESTSYRVTTAISSTSMPCAKGSRFRGERVAFSTFYSGIFRPRQMRGPAALSLTTAPPKVAGSAPYDDGFDGATEAFVYHYRSPQGTSANAVRAAEADNRALRAAAALNVPVIYFRGIGPGQYAAVAPRL